MHPDKTPQIRQRREPRVSSVAAAVKTEAAVAASRSTRKKTTAKALKVAYEGAPEEEDTVWIRWSNGYRYKGTIDTIESQGSAQSVNFTKCSIDFDDGDHFNDVFLWVSEKGSKWDFISPDDESWIGVDSLPAS